jgi:hypothetical protein
MNSSPAHRNDSRRSRDVSILSDGIALRARLNTPPGASALVVLLEDGVPEEALARALAAAGFATLRVDPAQHTSDFQDADALAATDQRCARICDVLCWTGTRAELAGRPVVLVAFGANGAAAVIEAARRPDLVRALALVDSTPTGAGPWLKRLRTPILAASRVAAPETLLPWLAAQLAAHMPDRQTPPDAVSDVSPGISPICTRSARPGNRPSRQTLRSGLIGQE